MISRKVILDLTLLSILFGVCTGQLLTPDQLREQENLGYGARTHYDLAGGRLTDMFRRVNPDYLLRGFLPFWSIVLIALALVFLLVALIGFIGFLLGCRRPTPEELIASENQKIVLEDQCLLQGDDSANVNGIAISTNDYLSDDRSIPSRLSPSQERTRIGLGSEDAV